MSLQGFIQEVNETLSKQCDENWSRPTKILFLVNTLSGYSHGILALLVDSIISSGKRAIDLKVVKFLIGNCFYFLVALCSTLDLSVPDILHLVIQEKNSKKGEDVKSSSSL